MEKTAYTLTPYDFIPENASEEYKDGFIDGYNNYLDYINWKRNVSNAYDGYKYYFTIVVNIIFSLLIFFLSSQPKAINIIISTVYIVLYMIHLVDLTKANEIYKYDNVSSEFGFLSTISQIVLIVYLYSKNQLWGSLSTVIFFLIFTTLIEYVYIKLSKKIYNWDKDMEIQNARGITELNIVGRRDKNIFK